MILIDPSLIWAGVGLCYNLSGYTSTVVLLKFTEKKTRLITISVVPVERQL